MELQSSSRVGQQFAPFILSAFPKTSNVLVPVDTKSEWEEKQKQRDEPLNEPRRRIHATRLERRRFQVFSSQAAHIEFSNMNA